MWHKRRPLDGLDDDIRAHIEHETDDYIARGVAPDEARRLARLTFGNVAVVKEDVRALWHPVWLEQLLKDVSFGLRLLRRTPLFTAAVVLSLALGIGANAAIFSLLNAVALRPLPVENPEGLWKIGNQYPYAAFRALASDETVLASVAAAGGLRLNVSIDGALEPTVNGQLVSGDYFRLLGIRPVLGRAIGPDDDRTPNAHPVVMLSDEYWASRFGREPSTIGRVITISGTPFTVVGVTPPGFFGIEVGTAPSLFVPILMQPTVVPVLGNPPRFITGQFRVLTRLRPGVTAAQATVGLESRVHGWLEREMGGRTNLSRFGDSLRAQLKGVNLWPELSQAATGFSNIRDEFSRPLMLLMAGVGILLLIACANTSNLLLARAAARQPEFGTRLALGASRWRLTRQVLIESIVLAGFGGVVGVGLAHWATRLLVVFISREQTPVALDVTPDTRVLVFTAACAVFTGVLFGVAPALRATGLHLMPTLRAPTSRHGSRLRLVPERLLAVSQIAMSLAMLVGAALFVRGLASLDGRGGGARQREVIVARVEPVGSYSRRRPPQTLVRIDREYKNLLGRIGALPGVRSVSLAEYSPANPGGIYRRATTPADAEVQVHQPMVYPRYFSTMGIPFVEGQDFAPRDIEENSPPVAVVNETFARLFFGQTPAVGQPCRVMATESALPCRIIGVVRDSPYADIAGDIVATMYQPFLQTDTNRGMMVLHVQASDDPRSVIPALRHELQRAHPTAPQFAIQTIADELDVTLVRQRLLATLGTVFSLLALLLAGFGLYGLFAFVVVRRTREIGLRMALGAGRRDIARMVIGEALTLVFAGVALGGAGGVVLSRLAALRVAGLLPGVDPQDPVALAAAVAILLTVAGIAAYLPARRASLIQPMDAVRAD
ncbi:MAG TPA: ABC transporter permease [Vicinamibacterales bacterium]|jgi:predicted permease|nr:ABC transporter permease [Vicinamibacterales bacterium]